MHTFSKKNLFSSVIATTVLAACGGSEDDTETGTDARSQSTVNTAVIQTVAADYTSSDVQLVDLTEETLSVSGGIVPKAKSDYRVKAFGDDYFHIGRFNIDEVSRYSLGDPSVPLYEYSTKEDVEEATTNPYDMVFVSATKAYLIRYGSDQVWIVNPQAETEAEFRLGELDLSDYADEDGIPEAANGIIVDGKLFIAMQRINRNNNWTPVEEGVPAYVAVFDVATDEEIDTNPSDDPSNPKGIVLETRNPEHFSYHPDAGLFLSAAGDPNSAWNKRDPGYVGGITRIDTNDYFTTLVVDDGSDAEADHPYGYLIEMTVLDDANGYFVGQAGFANSTLYHFNPSTGEVTGSVGEFLEGLHIGPLVTGPMGLAWVGVYDETDPRILLLNAAGELVEIIELIQNPAAIAFTAKDDE